MVLVSMLNSRVKSGRMPGVAALLVRVKEAEEVWRSGAAPLI